MKITLLVAAALLPACVTDLPTRDDQGKGKGDGSDTATETPFPTPVIGMFAVDGPSLAVLELDGDLRDATDAHRDATLLGGSFVRSGDRVGLALDGSAAQGLDWSAHAAELRYPYTIEMVLTADDTACYQKVFGTDDGADDGWYLCGGFEAYPQAAVGPAVIAQRRLYLAMVVTSAASVDVYEQGHRVGTTNASLGAGRQAMFFRDDQYTQRTEQFHGIVDAIRISSVARSDKDIAAQQARIEAQP